MCIFSKSVFKKVVPVNVLLTIFSFLQKHNSCFQPPNTEDRKDVGFVSGAQIQQSLGKLQVLKMKHVLTFLPSFYITVVSLKQSSYEDTVSTSNVLNKG